MSDKRYISLILLHVLIGFLVYLVPFTAKIYSYAILLAGIIYIVKKQNRNNEVLLMCAYMTGSEVLLRSTHGVPLYEFSKYATIIMLIYGMFYSGFSKNAIPYWMYLVLLIPGIIIAASVLNISTEDRKIISFTISGPLCIGIASLYTYHRDIKLQTMYDILLWMGLPVISQTVYLIAYTPTVKEVLVGTGSNFESSGNFGPNQVATIVGLGIFIFVSRAILNSKTILMVVLNLAIAAVMTFRGLVTFSRGGIITAGVMIALLILSMYNKFGGKAKTRLNTYIVALGILSVVVWSYTLVSTDGLIGKRYANQDAAGRVKESRLTGREELAETEWKMFYENPVTGVGVGKSIEVREEETGINSASHNEITRLLAEHGTLGILALLILFATPLFLHLDNRENFLMYPLFFFWLLTINHAAMRIAAPAFVYSLCLLKISIDGAPRKKVRRFPGMQPDFKPSVSR